MSSVTAEEALERAKAIASRLTGQSPTNANNSASHHTTSSSGSSSTSNHHHNNSMDGTAATATTTTTTRTNSSKRSRWGVTPELASSAAAAAVVAAAILPDVAKRAKTEESTTQKRLWISTSEIRPPGHFVAFLRDKLTTVIEEVTGNPDGSGDTGPKLTIELQGRGASSKPPPPGMPEQPLHILISGSKAAVEQVETKLEVLLMQAEQEPPLVPPESASNSNTTAVDNSRALTVTGGGRLTSSTSQGGTYRPASVAQLIGQANMAASGVEQPTDAADWVHEDVLVPNGVVGFIIGRGGENISSMQARTGCKVQIQKEHELQPGQTQRTITLSATNRQAVDECRDIILNMVREKAAVLGSNAPTSKDERVLQEALQAGHCLVQVPVPDADVGLIIGKNGSTIRSIQEQTGANIQVPQVADPGTTTRTINVTHPTEQGAHAAKQMIENILKSMPSFGQSNTQQQCSVQVSIPDKDVGLCIGRQGCVIREMQNKSGTRIQIPSHPVPGETHRIATVSGTKEGCEKVQQMIQSIILAQSSAPVMSGGAIGMSKYYGGAGGGVDTSQQQQYSAEWAAYHAAQAAAQQQYATSATQQQQQYAATAAQQTAAAAQLAAAQQQQQQPQPAADAYYEQFFRYAYYYGEEAARAHYGAWSPPVGTPNPYGVNPALAAAATPAAAPTTAPTAAMPTQQVATNTMSAAAAAASAEAARETGRRKVSNLPAWMTKN